MLTATEVECTPMSATVSNDGACNTDCVTHYEGTMDAAQTVPPSPGMDLYPSATLESYTVLLSPEIMIVDEDTSSGTYAAARDSVEQGMHLSQAKDTAKPVASVANFPKDTP